MTAFIYLLLQVLGIWAMFGSAFAYVEYMLDLWGKMDQAKFRRRMVAYGPISWLLNGGVWLFERRRSGKTAEPSSQVAKS